MLEARSWSNLGRGMGFAFEGLGGLLAASDGLSRLRYTLSELVMGWGRGTYNLA